MEIAYCSNECEINHSHIINDFGLEVIKSEITYVSVFDKQVCIMFKSNVMVSVGYSADEKKFSLHVANWENNEYNFTYVKMSNLSLDSCAMALQIIAKLSA